MIMLGILNNGKIMIERSLTELQGNISKDSDCVSVWYA